MPYFFMFAKDKDDRQVEEPNDCMMNRIVNAIKENRHQFRGIKNLAGINYLYLLKNQEDSYSNNEINRIYDFWNRRYGNNITTDEDYVAKNNIGLIAQQIKDDLHRVEPDDDKIINSLVGMLYKKPSEREKKLLWFIYGEELYTNIEQNVPDTPICWKCGRRTPYISRNICSECRAAGAEEGTREIECIDCGKIVEISMNNKRTVRCNDCQKTARKKMLWMKRNKIQTDSEGV